MSFHYWDIPQHRIPACTGADTPLPSACWDTPPARHPLPRPDTPSPGQTPCSVHAGIHTPAQCMLGYTPPPPSACWDTPPPGVATAADGMHPTGMHSSCLNFEIFSVLEENYLRWNMFLIVFGKFPVFPCLEKLRSKFPALYVPGQSWVCACNRNGHFSCILNGILSFKTAFWMAFVLKIVLATKTAFLMTKIAFWMVSCHSKKKKMWTFLPLKVRAVP